MSDNLSYQAAEAVYCVQTQWNFRVLSHLPQYCRHDESMLSLKLFVVNVSSANLTVSRLLPDAVNCVRFCFQRCLWLFFFLCESNISGTAKRICAKFTGRKCFVPRSKFLNAKVKAQRSRPPGTKTRCALPSPPPRQRRNGPFCCMTHCNALAANNVMQQQTGPFRRCWGWFRLPACGLCLVNVYSSSFIFICHLLFFLICWM